MPDHRDDVIFDGTPFDGSVRNSVVDAAFGGVVKRFIIESTHPEGNWIRLDKDLKVLADTGIHGGTLDGSENLLIGPNDMGQPPASFSWSGGKLKGTGLTASVIIDQSVTAYISGLADLTMEGRSIHSYGNLIWNSGNLTATDSQISVEPGGTFTVSTGTNTTFQKAGTWAGIWVSGGATMNVAQSGAEFALKAGLTDFGSINVTEGAFRLFDDSWITGTTTISGGARLDFEAGAGVDHDLGLINVGATFTGTGLVRFKEGSKIHLTDNVVVNNVRDLSEVVDGTGNLQINADYTWGGKTWDGTGTVQVGTAQATGAKLYIGDPAVAPPHALNRKLVNYGTTEWRRGHINLDGPGGSIENKAGATFDIKIDALMVGGIGAGKFTNAGLLKKTEGPGFATIGIEVVPAGGRIEEHSGTLRVTEKMSMLNGEIEVYPTATLAFDGGLDQAGGSILIHGGGEMEVTGLFDQTGGLVFLDGGVLTATGGYDIGTDATLIGNGEIWADVLNEGLLSAGTEENPFGTFLIHGDFTQTTGTWLVHVTHEGWVSDHLVVDGQATLGGELWIYPLGGRFPLQEGDTFVILTAAGGLVDEFDVVTYPMSLGFAFEVDYGATALTLTWVAV